SYTGTKCPHTDLALKVDVNILSAALVVYENHFHVSLSPAPSDHPAIQGGDPKYFIHTDHKSGDSQLVDIHIFRGGKEICVKQDLNFELHTNDIIEIGELVC
ncbi:MAG: hypothetical protein K2X81_12045, partial [Candidatus Obscuribacterales bacterium]|nr:hypothetical protein [Candidatus Obscuribacterales bacterium]